jgi:hypothetical protein
VSIAAWDAVFLSLASLLRQLEYRSTAAPFKVTTADHQQARLDQVCAAAKHGSTQLTNN